MEWLANWYLTYRDPDAFRRVFASAGLQNSAIEFAAEPLGIGLYAKLDAYALQDGGMDTYEANRALGHADDERDYAAAAQMLHALAVTEVALLSNNPDKATQLTQLGVRVTELVPTRLHLSAANASYLV